MKDYWAEEVEPYLGRDWWAEEVEPYLGEEEELFGPQPLGLVSDFTQRRELAPIQESISPAPFAESGAGVGRIAEGITNLLRDIPGFIASFPTMAMPPPIRDVAGLIGKAAEPIKEKVEGLPFLAPLKAIEDKVFGEGALFEPEITPQSQQEQVYNILKPMITGEVSVPEAALGVAESTPVVGAPFRAIKDPESLLERPLPYLMDLAILLGGAGALARGKKGTTKPVEAKAEVPDIFPGLREKVIPEIAPGLPEGLLEGILGLEKPKAKPQKLKAEGVGKETPPETIWEEGTVKQPAPAPAGKPAVAAKGKFYINQPKVGDQPGGFIEVKGRTVKGIPDVDAFVHRPLLGSGEYAMEQWLVTEARTGHVMGRGATQKAAIANAKELIGKLKPGELEKYLREAVEKRGESPRYAKPPTGKAKLGAKQPFKIEKITPKAYTGNRPHWNILRTESNQFVDTGFPSLETAQKAMALMKRDPALVRGATKETWTPEYGTKLKQIKEHVLAEYPELAKSKAIVKLPLGTKDFKAFRWDAQSKPVGYKSGDITIQMPVTHTTARGVRPYWEVRIADKLVQRRFKNRTEAIDYLKAEYPELGKKGQKVRVTRKKGEEPAFEGKGRLELEIEAETGKPQDLPSIVQGLSQDLGIPIRTGYFRRGGRGVLGIYKKGPETVRIKTANDLATVSHEVAHHLDKVHDVTKTLSKEIKAEVSKLDYDPVKARTSEGFAEFVRHWLTDESAADVAPKTNAWFEGFVKERPDLAKILKRAKVGIARWRKQGADARIKATLVSKPSRFPRGGRETLKSGWLEFRRAVDDALAPIEVFTKEAQKKLREPLLERKDPFAIATAVRNASGTKARQWFDVATSDFDGRVTGPSLKVIFQGVRGKEMGAVEYAFAKHALERWKKGKNPGIDKADAEWYVQKHKSPEFDTFAKELSAFSDKALDYVIDSGAFSKETANLFREVYDNYLPLFREMEATTGGTGGAKGKGFADLPTPFRRATGSGRRVLNPVSSIMLQTERLISWADRARVGKTIVELAEEAGGMGEWIERVAIPAQKTKLKIGDVLTGLKKEGIDLKTMMPEEALTPEFMNEFMTFWSTRIHGVPKENIVTFFDKKGNLHAYQLKPALYKAVKQMDGLQLPHALRIATAPVRWGKKAVALGATGLRASFGWGTNLIRDPGTYYMQSKNPRANPLGAFGGTAKAVKNKLGWHPSESWRMFQQVGGEFGTFMNVELPRAMKTAKRMMKDNKWSKGANVLRHPFELYREVINIPESGPRFAEFQAIYKRRLKETGDHRSAWIAALNASKDVTVNFSRLGYMTQIANQFVPFIGPQVAGLGKVVRSFKNNPVRTTIRGLGLTAATIALWNMNKEEEWYKALPAWDKYGFWHFKLSEEEDAPIYRIPRPFEWGLIFSSMPEATANKMFEDDPEAMKELYEVAWDQIIPPTMPALIGPGIDVSRGEGGYDPFRGRQIVPHYEVQNLPPEERTGRYTTETAEAVGKFLGVSPRKVDYTINALTGGGGSDIIRGVEAATKPSLEKTDLPEIPFIGRFVSRSPYLNAFYRFYEKADKAESRWKTLSGEAEEGFYQENRDLLGSIGELRSIARSMSAIRKRIKAVKEDKTLSPRAIREKVEQLDNEIERLARRGVKLKEAA